MVPAERICSRLATESACVGKKWGRTRVLNLSIRHCQKAAANLVPGDRVRITDSVKPALLSIDLAPFIFIWSVCQATTVDEKSFPGSCVFVRC